MPATSEPTSCCFVARLGNLDPAAEHRLRKWAAASCAEHILRRGADGLALYAVRHTERTARQFQTSLRTLSSHWRLPFGKLESRWVQLLAVEDYRAAIAGTPAAAAPAAEALPPTPPPAGVEALEQRRACRAEEPVFLTALSDEFVERSQSAIARLRVRAC